MMCYGTRYLILPFLYYTKLENEPILITTMRKRNTDRLQIRQKFIVSKGLVQMYGIWKFWDKN